MSVNEGAWAAVKVVIPESLARLLADEVAALGPDGMLIEDRGTLGGAGLGPGDARLTVYTAPGRADAIRAGLCAQLIRHGSCAAIAVEHGEPQDWNALWKSHYGPVDIGSGLRVVPAWQQAGKTERVVVRIDPGQAFGTGTHETTQLVARLMQEVEGGCRGRSVLDIGTGSALLAIAAAGFGAGPVVGIDRDPVAIESARGNLVLNDCEAAVELRLANRPGELAAGRFDLVLANIISSTLLALRDDIVVRTRPGGLLLLSGVLAAEQGVFLDDFLPPEWVVERRLQAAEWVGFAVRSPR